MGKPHTHTREKLFMQKLSLALLLCVAMMSVASAQTSTPNTASGDKALIFSISGLGSFGITGSYVTSVPLSGTLFDSTDVSSFFESFGVNLGRPLIGLGFKAFVADDIALRTGLSVLTTSKTTPLTDSTETRSSTFGFGISPALEIHLANSGPVTAYTGVVLSYGTYSKTSNATPSDTTEVSNTASTFGGGAMLGVEFTPWTNIGLGAEYQIGLTTTSVSKKERGKTTDGASTTDIGIGTFAVSLNVYF